MHSIANYVLQANSLGRDASCELRPVDEVCRLVQSLLVSHPAYPEAASVEWAATMHPSQRAHSTGHYRRLHSDTQYTTIQSILHCCGQCQSPMPHDTGLSVGFFDGSGTDIH